MKMPARFVVVCLLASILLSAAGLKGASAQTTLTNDQLKQISDNCLSIKNTLNQLHASDALLRVNRGQLYEAIGTKLMDRFNGRLTSNNLDAVGTLEVTSGYRTALNAFRSDYQAYEQSLADAIKIDCDKQPSDFHTAIEDARTKRSKVHADVISLNQYVDDYRSAVNDFFINYQRVTGEQ